MQILITKNKNKFYCISELKQCLVNIWQSSAERYWHGHQQLKKVTACMRVCRETIF